MHLQSFAISPMYRQDLGLYDLPRKTDREVSTDLTIAGNFVLVESDSEVVMADN